MLRLAVVVIPLLAAGHALAQQSASYRVSDHAFNAGGHPADGSIGTSSGFRVTLDALGETASGHVLAASSYRVDGAFAATYPPPGEVHGLRFATRAELRWTPERSVGTYDLYRGEIAALPGTYGTCLQPAIASETWSDPSVPPAGAGFFYLATAVNRLGEKGTKGQATSGTERDDSLVCP